MNSIESTMAFRLGDIVRMNPLVFLGSKVERIPNSFWMRCISTECYGSYFN